MTNDLTQEKPIENWKLKNGYWLLKNLVSLSFRCGDGLSQDPTELVALAAKVLYLMSGQQFRQNDKLKPSFCFHQLFQSDVGLVSKVSATFTRTCFIIIWWRRRATAHDLARNMSS